MLNQEKQKRPGGGGIWPKSGKRETVVSEEVEDRDYKDNGLLEQPNKPLNREAHSSNRDLSRPKEET